MVSSSLLIHVLPANELPLLYLMSELNIAIKGDIIYISVLILYNIMYATCDYSATFNDNHLSKYIASVKNSQTNAEHSKNTANLSISLLDVGCHLMALICIKACHFTKECHHSILRHHLTKECLQCSIVTSSNESHQCSIMTWSYKRVSLM